ncbi:MAG: 4-hydroxy-tetrahydrodipicolinate reductase [Leptospiraceae bacterium]|nr:4-hydroxy-tetrahydrodipicolinate reductase [Leptospiraceae bacterium]
MVGAGGRMGRTIIALSKATATDLENPLQLVGALENSGSDAVGRDAGSLAGLEPMQVVISPELATAIDPAKVVIDFSSPANTLRVAEYCARQAKALVVGTTGFSTTEKSVLEGFADRIPLLIAPNMSVGVNLLFHLVEQAARSLRDGYDMEIVEAHHHHKKDAPSGTAMRLKEVLLAATKRTEADVVYGREGLIGARPAREIGVHTLRGGDVVGDHTVYFFGDGERVELTHRAASRNTFAAGALRAAAYLAGQSPGLYHMRDVLNI